VNIDIEKHLTTLRDVGPLYAEAKGERVLLDESLKIAKAEAFREATGTVAEREAAALTSTGYRIALDGLAAAIEQEEKHRRALITAEAAIEVWRSLESSRRALDRGAA